MILTSPEGELGLEKELVSRDRSALNRRLNAISDGGFKVMAALVGGVDAPEALSQGKFRQPLGLVLLPRGPVQESRHTDAVDQSCSLGHRVLLPDSRPLILF